MRAALPADARRRAALLTALAVTLAAFAGQALTVHANYGGQWTGLFCVGERFDPAPLGLRPAHLFRGADGYDGQFYRIVAHDPWLAAGYWKAVDGPELRYRRILVPLLAWVAAGGRGELVDTAYIAIVLACLFLGVYFLGLYLVDQGLPPAAGAVFLLLPGTLISLDRMLPDIALYMLIAALLAVWRGRLTPWSAFVLALAPLVRDLGLLVVAAALAHLAARRRWRDAVLGTLCVLPAAAWFVWLRMAMAQTESAPSASFHAGVVPSWALRQPVYGLFMRMAKPAVYPGVAPHFELAAQALDLLAYAGMALALVLAVVAWRRWSVSLEGWLMAAFVALFPFASSRRFWEDSYSYPRAYTPLLALLALEGWRRRQWWWALPLALVVVRTVWPMGRQALNVVLWLIADA